MQQGKYWGCSSLEIQDNHRFTFINHTISYKGNWQINNKNFTVKYPIGKYNELCTENFEILELSQENMTLKIDSTIHYYLRDCVEKNEFNITLAKAPNVPCLLGTFVYLEP